jgi:menaquinone-9 beta-reductase
VNVPSGCDVLVAGAGPAGAITAAVLARQEMDVLLVDWADDGISHDILVTAPALRGLAEAGVGTPHGARPADVIDLRFGPDSRRAVPDFGAVICDRARFRRGLRRAATRAGVRSIRGTAVTVVREQADYQVTVETAAGATTVAARHVVLATGSASRGGLAGGGLPPSADGPATGDPPRLAGLACAQRFSGARPGAQLALALSAPSGTAPDAPPTCAWALPGVGGLLTVGTARVGGGSLPTPGELMRDALATLALAGVGPVPGEPAGPLISGSLNAGFTPAGVAQARCLVVGDGAGLVNPFTGEGLSFAVQSGLMAARAIGAHPSDPDAARRAYARRLRSTFVGYFETARNAARRYQLAWRILASGAESDHPFFAKGRRAMLLPEGFSGLTAAERMDLTDPDAVLLVPFLAACDEVAITTIRDEWPFLGRLAMAGETLGHQRLRPAVPFFAALISSGRMPPARRATLAAAIELALLGAVAMLGPAPRSAGGRGIDWAFASTVLAGDFLLSQAARLVAESAPEVSWSFADWLAELTALRCARLGVRPRVPAGAVYAALFEFPSRVGALLGGGSPPVVTALRDFGYHCGRAFGHTEDVLALEGQRTRLDTTLAVMLDGGFSGACDWAGGDRVGADAFAADPELRSRALAAARAASQAAVHRALLAADAVPDAVAARILRRFVEAVAAPIHEPGRPAENARRSRPLRPPP